MTAKMVERIGTATVHFGDSLQASATWEAPDCIVSDGPYGIGGYPGDPRTHRGLADAYRAHAEAWAEAAKPSTTLWFWNTEVGWATVHPVLEEAGWEYRGLNVWDKGIGHVAGNCNGKTMRKFPVVTEVCAHYVRRSEFRFRSEGAAIIRDWLRGEWLRTGLPMSEANAACGVKSAATRKWLSADQCFYPPPADAFAALAAYANAHGKPEGKPYFDLASGISGVAGSDWERIRSSIDWERIRAKFNFEYGASNVWSVQTDRGSGRLKVGGKAVHLNQKPLALMERVVAASTDTGEVVWEPFGGLMSASAAAMRMGRRSFSSETNPAFHAEAVARLTAIRIRTSHMRPVLACETITDTESAT